MLASCNTRASEGQEWGEEVLGPRTMTRPQGGVSCKLVDLPYEAVSPRDFGDALQRGVNFHGLQILTDCGLWPWHGRIRRLLGHAGGRYTRLNLAGDDRSY